MIQHFSMKSKTKIHFRNFPHDFNKDDNFFLQLVKDALNGKNYPRDIYFYGSYPDKSLVRKILLFMNSKLSNKGMTTWLKFQQGVVTPIDESAFNVWCTFENRRPPVHGFDCTFTFDRDNLKKTNFYLPLIFLYLKVNSATSKHNIEVAELLKKRKIPLEFLSTKKEFMASFINNPHPVRMHAVKQLQEIGDVTLYGRSVDNYVVDKIRESSRFWFNLCFENDLYPGYITEKVLEAYLSKSVPLYWGDDSAGIINPKAIVNLKDFENIDEFTLYVKNLFDDKQRIKEMLEEPLFLKEFNYSDVLSFFTEKLNQPELR